MKKLFILTKDLGDGSYYPAFIMDEEVIRKIEVEMALIEGKYGCLGCDGDGFHYKEVSLPDECTPESLGISVMTWDEVKEYNGWDDDEQESSEA